MQSYKQAFILTPFTVVIYMPSSLRVSGVEIVKIDFSIEQSKHRSTIALLPRHSWLRYAR